ncbi:hydrogenase expression/formation protein HypE [Mycolicibacterium duvalii]|uniref:Hydrogenase expression/formation protein HypE n=1 Tax=Mycolicibacterium duvalii TaxID=39688 RepID=A0A7I7K896_9MYCO|nr:hydrogenase expression/formation protein HypE [Mycolicibacterium duvalii]MCV7366468.1 hydrogenase expression/formation protein HypE [Mycolicibacterium duvalii]PEG43746.1 hydrogenase expression/formation protein HypE [Mycolicibacterium duvalii]BBX20295.1 hydrogenase expression/formation protein HypE [Mycolicibacterium duvalii]
MTAPNPAYAACPVPQPDRGRVRLGHGSGGQLMTEMIDEVIVAELGGAGVLEDAAIVDVDGTDIVVSTDSFVVTPRFFPGGDIGSLAVHGTINDVAMRGARPVALTLAYVIEEGLELAELRAITASVAVAAAECGVPVVTGDTKVVDNGAADGIYLTTTGVGHRLPSAAISAGRARPGDVVIVSGPIGAHGVAVLCARGDLGFDTDLRSDSRPLHDLVTAMVAAGGEGVHALRDPTRGGLASALNEIAQASRVGIDLIESDIPVPTEVRSACDLLGLDPLHVASEGCLVAMITPQAAAPVLAAMRGVSAGAHARVIGRVVDGPRGRVTATTLMGARRIVDTLVGEQLPRIC